MVDGGKTEKLVDIEIQILEIVCEHCKTINIVSHTDYPERDKGSVDCAISSETLLNWKGTLDFYSSRSK